MNPEILAILFVFLMFLFVGSVAMSIFLLYDIKSGNYRKFLSVEQKHTEIADKVQGVRGKNLGKET